MKALSIIATSVLVSAVAMTSAQANRADNDGAGVAFLMKMTDTNADGKISKDEFMKMKAKSAAKDFMMMDMDDDGSVSMEEYMFMMTNR